MSKIRVILKDPDALQDAINDLLDEELKDMPEDEAAAIRELRGGKYREIASKWFEYGEYLTVVIDLEAKTIDVESTG